MELPSIHTRARRALIETRLNLRNSPCLETATKAIYNYISRLKDTVEDWKSNKKKKETKWFREPEANKRQIMKGAQKKGT